MQLFSLITAAFITTCVVKIRASSNGNNNYQELKFNRNFTRYYSSQNYHYKPSSTKSAKRDLKVKVKRHNPSIILPENDVNVLNVNSGALYLHKSFSPTPLEPKRNSSNKSIKTELATPYCKKVSKRHDHFEQALKSNTVEKEPVIPTLLEDSFSKLSFTPKSTTTIGQEENYKKPSNTESTITDYQRISNNYDHSNQISRNNINIIGENSKTPTISENLETLNSFYIVDFPKQSFPSRESIFKLEEYICNLKDDFKAAQDKFRNAKPLYDMYTGIAKNLNEILKKNELPYNSNDLNSQNAFGNTSLEEIKRLLGTCFEQAKQKKIIIDSYFTMRIYKTEELTTLETLTKEVAKCSTDMDMKQLKDLYFNELKNHVSFEKHHQKLLDSIISEDEEVSQIQKHWTKVLSDISSKTRDDKHGHTFDSDN